VGDMTLTHLQKPSTLLSRSNIFRNSNLNSRKFRSKMSAHMTICEKSDISNLPKSTFRKSHYIDLDICVFIHFGRFMQHKDRGSDY